MKEVVAPATPIDVAQLTERDRGRLITLTTVKTYVLVGFNKAKGTIYLDDLGRSSTWILGYTPDGFSLTKDRARFRPNLRNGAPAKGTIGVRRWWKRKKLYGTWERQ